MTLPDSMLPVILVGIGLVTGLALFAWYARTSRSRDVTSPASNLPALGMSAGMLLGALLGVIVWVSTGNFVFWVVFMGGGMVSGLAIGTSWAARGH